mgnify:FL=1
MAAKLKKMAMAEYNSSVVQVEDSNSSSSSAVSDRAKRLKLSLRESISDVENVVREVMAKILGYSKVKAALNLAS